MRRRGFTLFEVLIAVVLLSAFTLLSSQLFMTCIRSTTEARRSEAALFRFDGAATLLRRDVWNSTSIKVLTPHAVVIQQPGGRSMTWQVDDHDGLVRTEGDGAKGTAKQFPGLNAAFVFRAEPAALVLEIRPRAAGVPAQEVRFISALSIVRSRP